MTTRKYEPSTNFAGYSTNELQDALRAINLTPNHVWKDRKEHIEQELASRDKRRDNWTYPRPFDPILK